MKILLLFYRLKNKQLKRINKRINQKRKKMNLFKISLIKKTKLLKIKKKKKVAQL